MDDTNVSNAQGGRDQWLLLMAQLPPKPDYLRVKLRRRIQQTGAVPLKNAVYLLPYSDEALEDFVWVRAELSQDGADATIWTANVVVGMEDEELHALFAARGERASRTLHGRTWVTRKGVFVDRIASAWLIKRFIDPAAKFKFVAGTRYKPQENELRFDMFEGEYTHEGDLCTFETLLAHFGLKDRALKQLAEIVHDIDCKDGKFGRAEAGDLAKVLRGLTAAEPDDEKRIAAGSALFETLYAYNGSNRTLAQ